MSDSWIGAIVAGKAPDNRMTLSRTQLMTQVTTHSNEKASLFASNCLESGGVWPPRVLRFKGNEQPDIRTPDGRTDSGEEGARDGRMELDKIMQSGWQLHSDLWLLFDSQPHQPLTVIHYSQANEDINIPAAGERRDAIFYLTALKEHR